MTKKTIIGGFFAETFYKCEKHLGAYPKGAKCPRCEQEKIMAEEIDIDVIMNYNDLNTVIAGLIELRNQHGGKSHVDVEIEYEPYDDGPGHPRVFLIVPEKNNG